MDEKQNTIIEGEIREALPNTMFKILLNDGREVLCTLSGRMRKNYVRVFPGDKVRVEMTPYDDKRGRIVYKI
ncbi:MAG: translation initiation factor IF-1 [Patescibacteria group bacterium]